MSISEKLANFLLAYRNAEHSTIGEKPLVLFMGRPLRSRLDLLKPDLHRDISKKQSSQLKKRSPLRTFNVGQSVLARDYCQGKQKWQPGEVVSKTGPLTYTVQVSPRLIWRRHVDQLLDATTQHSTHNDTRSGAGCMDSSEEFSSFALDEPQVAMDTPAPETDSPTVSPRPVPDPEEERRYLDRTRHPPRRLDL